MTAQNLVNNDPGSWYRLRASELRSIASTVEPTYPSSASTLRGIASGLVEDRPTLMDQAAAKQPTRLGWLFVACLAVIMVMLTIKLGVVLFT